LAPNKDSIDRPAPRPESRRVFFLLPLLALGIPLLVNDYVQYTVNLILVYVLVGVGFNIVIGNLGQLAFANAAFFGVGAYATGILMVQLQAPFLAALVAAGVIGGLAGALISLPALRGIRGFYLAIITLAFGELMRWFYIHAESITLGSMGLHVPEPTVFGLALKDDHQKFYVFLVVVTLLVTATANLLRSRIGRAFISIRDNEAAAASMGIPTARYFVLAFAWSGLTVGIAGGLYAALVQQVSPDAFTLLELIVHFAIVIVGGLASLAGSVIGAVILTAAPEFIRDFPGFEELLLAALMILILLFLPRGIVSVLAKYLPIFRERYYRE
jgi:branched-chain amino acid transport system permease protein